ncbi:hypothetical protein [uncultured Paludibaculum sp.]|uniref:hypothetical protein n=1 Tax=uncultured Paludibaculum sp. TaxID=1765020 RepID=UPI002AAA9A4A|nr:hypothetical protein [uncultured Paludibaculum sp.]
MARDLDVAQFSYWRRVLAGDDQEERAPGQFVLLGQDLSVHAGDEDPALELETTEGCASISGPAWKKGFCDW